MTSGPYCLNWKTKAEHFHSALSGLLQQEKLCDVTILCGGQVFKAHQLVLGICSEYFQTALQDVPAGQHPIIFLRDVAADEFRYMLDYMYKGEVILPGGILNRFLETCKLLRIKELYQADTQSESDESDSSQESSPNKRPIRRKNTKKKAQKPTLLVNPQNAETSQDTTVANLEASQIIEETNGGNILDSPPHSPSSLVFSFNKSPESRLTNDILIVQDDNDVIVLSDDNPEEPSEETPSGNNLTAHSVDQNTFMEGIELLKKPSQARNAGDSDQSHIIFRKTRTIRKTAERNKNQTNFELENKNKAIRNARNLKVVLSKIPQDESSNERTDKNEGTPSKRKKISSHFREDNV